MQRVTVTFPLVHTVTLIAWLVVPCLHKLNWTYQQCFNETIPKTNLKCKNKNHIVKTAVKKLPKISKISIFYFALSMWNNKYHSDVSSLLQLNDCKNLIIEKTFSMFLSLSKKKNMIHSTRHNFLDSCDLLGGLTLGSNYCSMSESSPN